MSILFNVLTGVTIAVIMPIIGALLVSAVIVLPAAISLRLSKSFNGVILFGIIIALIGTSSGLITSYELGTPPGASITLILIIIFAFTILMKYIMRHIKLEKLFNRSDGS